MLSNVTEHRIRGYADCEACIAPIPLGVPSIPSFHVVGVSHHTTSVAERERFALSRADTDSALERFRREGRLALVLSTCNRCELYWCGAPDGDAWFLSLARSRGTGADLSLARYHGMAAVRHLFLVSSGLDSQILGETEILSQVRRAYDAARAAGTTTREMDLIFSAALAAGRRVRRDTVLGRHPASVSSAAVEVGRQRLGAYSERNVVVLGAGEAAEGVLRALDQQGDSRVTLLTRHPEKARALAAAWGAEAGSWEELDQRLQRADLLFVATASARPVVTAAQLARAAGPAGRRFVVIDLAVPRNVEPSSGAIGGIELLNLDDLQRLCCPAGETPSEALAEAEAIVEDEVLRLGLSLRGREAAPRLAELHRLSQAMAEEESEWALAQLDSLSDEERQVVREMAGRLVRRVLYPVSRSLRAVEGQEESRESRVTSHEGS